MEELKYYTFLDSKYITIASTRAINHDHALEKMSIEGYTQIDWSTNFYSEEANLEI